MDNKKKIFKIVELSALAFFVLVFIGCIVFEIAIPEASFSKWLQDNVWDIRETLVSIKSHIPVFIRSIIYIALVYAISKILRAIFKSKMKRSNRTKTNKIRDTTKLHNQLIITRSHY